MFDVIAVVGLSLLFSLSFLYVSACEHLKGKRS